MQIKWLGHSCFKLTESTGTTLVTDPYYNYIGHNLPEVSADIVSISHQHKDHCNAKSIQGNPIVIDKIGFYDVKGIHINAFSSAHDNEKGRLRGKNNIFKFRIDGVDICHLGDIGQDITPFLVDALVPINILMIPIGGKYTIDCELAKKYIDYLMPDIVIPMHYKSKGSTLDIDEIDNFLDLFEDEQIVYLDTNEIDFDRMDFDNDETKIIVFKID